MRGCFLIRMLRECCVPAPWSSQASIFLQSNGLMECFHVFYDMMYWVLLPWGFNFLLRDIFLKVNAPTSALFFFVGLACLL